VQKPKRRENGPHVKTPRPPCLPPGTGPVVLAPFAVALDWLTLDMRSTGPNTFVRVEPWTFTSEELAPGRVFVLRPTPHRTSVFRTVAIIEDNTGEKLATITSDPHTTVIGPDTWFQVQFANVTLYSGEWVALFRILRYAWGCTFNAVSRVDIATDGLQGDGGDWTKVIQRSWTGEARYYGKSDWRPRFKRANVEGAEFGTRASNKFIRAYCKSREMKAVQRKAHIESLWTLRLGRNPMHTGEEVNRLEVQCKGREIRRYWPRENDALWVEGLATGDRLVDMFASMVPTMFDFRIPAERARDAESIVSWDWSRLRDGVAHQVDRAARNFEMSDHQVKVALKAMWRVGYVTCDGTAQDMARQFAGAVGPHMVEWYERQRVTWIRELNRLYNQDPRALDVFNRLAEGVELSSPLKEASEDGRETFAKGAPNPI
jgi:hypothetical protein